MKGVIIKAFYVDYKFIIPNNTKKSAYLYQKLFRALYGYTQNVSKSNGKNYSYRRKGLLEQTPFIKPGKNSIIIPSSFFSKLINFFKTGENPAHLWASKGDWKAVYYVDEREISFNDVLEAVETWVNKKLILNENNNIVSLIGEIKSKNFFPDAYKKEIIFECNKIISNEWSKSVLGKSKALNIITKFLEQNK